MGEFELIDRFFRGVALEGAGEPSAVILGIGDDAALLNIKPGQQLVISTDSLVQGTHFPDEYSPDDLAYRAVAVAVSDIAAMAGRPLAFTLALTLPEVNESWLARFAAGLTAAARDFEISLVGGDTTRGPLNIGVTVLGRIRRGQEMRRQGARPGDLLCVGGPLGDGAAGLSVVLGESLPSSLDEADRAYLVKRFWRPQAQCGLGLELARVASAGLDVSDGLLADAGHLARESAVALHIVGAALPCSPALKRWPEAQRLEWMLTGGDDYVLLFTLPPASYERLDVWRSAGWPVSVIGKAMPGEGVWLDAGKGPERFDRRAGYQHFQGTKDV
ncbi:MAG TPA: thiamine-phosphate kinase [Pseudomonas xinjiangensis]|uniref:Thiamine-monophosphate kinase n=1 Tax=Halopseudomonas xinjiangensis TaxID=487184 RepID=A0A7V1BS69_9GAMM|nr:thiamine-phosphate kinase [Halopseudomonas xinjiangensis]HEC48871.1 thiamine-phosphate kinase [Halopseudomonas xinjiangensis]